MTSLSGIDVVGLRLRASMPDDSVTPSEKDEWISTVHRIGDLEFSEFMAPLLSNDREELAKLPGWSRCEIFTRMFWRPINNEVELSQSKPSKEFSSNIPREGDSIEQVMASYPNFNEVAAALTNVARLAQVVRSVDHACRRTSNESET